MTRPQDECPSCFNRIPPLSLACPVCTTRRAMEFLDRRQLEVLPKVYRDEGALVMVGAKGAPHVQMFGDPITMFCGITVGAHNKRTREPYCEATLKKACVKCRIRLAALMEEALAGSVQTDVAQAATPQ